MTTPDYTILRDQLAALEHLLALSELQGLGQDVLGLLEAKAAAVRQQLTGQAVAPDSPSGHSPASSPTVGHVVLTGGQPAIVVGANTGTIYYSAQPTTDEHRTIRTYLQSLAARLSAPTIQRGNPGLARLPLLRANAAIARSLATMTSRILFQGAAEDAATYFELDDPRRDLLPAYHPDTALPDTAILRVLRDGRQTSRGLLAPPSQSLTLERAELLTEALDHHQTLIILGGPGSGKSTFLRQYAEARATQILDAQEPMISGSPARIPILVPASRLAQHIHAHSVDPTSLRTVLQRVLHEHDGFFSEALLVQVLHDGALLLMLDGLDEVPMEATATTASRRDVAEAMVALCAQYPQVQLVMTCRERAFDEKLAAMLPWPARQLAPWTMGQIRHAVKTWYDDFEQAGTIAPDQAAPLTEALLATLTEHPHLRSLAASPLLLSMMALVLAEDGHLPRDRSLLYERVMLLLLGEWDCVRQQVDLAQSIGLSGWTSARLRPVIDQLAFMAHAHAGALDGQARLARSMVRDTLITFFEDAGVSEPWERARRTLGYLDQRSGLLMPDGPDDYAFVHLTFQEYAAGCHLVRVLKPATDAILQRRHDDRWQEPILLGLGAIIGEHPSLVSDILTRLTRPDEHGKRKNRKRWYRDLILAGDIAEDRTWEQLRASGVDAARIQHDLRTGLVDLLEDTKQPLPVSERACAGFILGHVGDPRYPVTLMDWKKAIKQTLRGDGHPYFCRVDAGDYWIGSDDSDLEAQPWERPRRKITLATPFWISRFPITTDQWRVWPRASAWQKAVGEDAEHSHPNQPVGSVSWNEIQAWCDWLSAETRSTITLPTTLEWEMAARGPKGLIYPWGNRWKSDHAALGETDLRRRRSAYQAPVGCYPQGAAPCGALDMAGSIWEWTGTLLSYAQVRRTGYPEKMILVWPQPQTPEERDAVQFCAIKGGSPPFLQRCGRGSFAIYWQYQNPFASSDRGFRIVLRATGEGAG